MDFSAQLREASRSVEDDPQRFPQVIAWFEQLARGLKVKSDAHSGLLLGQVLVQQGNLYARLAGRSSNAQALSCYREAAQVLVPVAQAGDEAALAELGGVYGNRARILQEMGGAEHLADALHWATAAADTFSRLSWQTDLRYGHNLLAAIFNLAGFHDAAGDPEAALAKIDLALQASHQLQVASAQIDLLLAEIWLNRGNLVASLDPVDALLAWTAAIEVLVKAPDTGSRYRFALAGALANRANLMAYAITGADAATSARLDARAALEALAGLQARSPEAADVALRAGWALCGALGQLLFGEGDLRESLNLYEEATDSVESALNLIQVWNRNGREVPWKMTSELFRFGCDLYWRLDPGFLIDFISETVSGFEHNGEVGLLLKAEADFAVARCIEDLEKSRWIVHGSVEAERLLAMLSRLRHFQNELAA